MSGPVTTVVSAACVWLILGMSSAGPVDRTLRDLCQGSLGSPSALAGHVAVWPVSVLATMGMRSRC